MEICFGIADGEFCPFLTELSARNTAIFYFQENNLSKPQWIFTKFDICIDIVEICFWIAHWQILSIFDRVICPQHDNGGVLSFLIISFLENRIWHFIQIVPLENKCQILFSRKNKKNIWKCPLKFLSSMQSVKFDTAQVITNRLIYMYQEILSSGRALKHS